MFGNMNKPAFGSPAPNTSFGFGAPAAANTNPFGQSQLFGKPGTSAFGAPSTTTFGQPASSSLFPSMQAQPTNLFQNANTSFGAPPSTQSGFVSLSTGSTGLFGQQQPAGGGLFNTSSTFGQPSKPTAFGFGTPSTQPSLFGQQQQPQSASLFQPSTSNLFGGASAFGGQQQTGTTVKFNPMTGTDTMMKNGTPTSINTKHMSITCMKEYENKSFEELRFEDYVAGRKGPQQQTGFGGTPFGAPVSSAPSSLFGQPDASKPTFGQSTAFGQTTSNFGQATAFGMAAPQQQTNLFAKPTGFGAPTSSTGTFGLGTAQNANPFGATQAKPFGSTTQPMFGASTNTTQSAFGTGLFGQTNTQSTSLFGKPAQPTTGFGAQPNTGFSFSTPAASTQSTGLFTQNKPLFGQATTNTGFGQTNTFGATSATPFGTSFAKPATPGFGTGQVTGFGTTLGSVQPQGSSLFGSTAPKPGGLFGSTTSTGLFGNTSSTFQPSTGFGTQQQQPQQMFAPQPESYPISNISLLASDQFGDAPHLAGLDIRPKSGPSTVSTTNPKELKALLDASKKIDTPSNTKLKVEPIRSIRDSLFEGLSMTSSDSVPDSEYRKSNCRRLVLKHRPNKSSDSNKVDILKLISSPDENKENKRTAGTAEVNSPSDFKVVPLKLNFDNTMENHGSPLGPSTYVVNDSRHKDSSLVIDKNAPIDPDFDILDERATPPLAESTTTTKTQHPCGIICTRPEYYTLPSLDELPQYLDENGQCIVKGFTIGRKRYGNVYYSDEMDVANLNIDELVHFRYREISVYPDDSKKPPVGQELNRKAQVTVDGIYPRRVGTNSLVTDVGELLQMNFMEKLRKVTVKKGAKFVDYRPETGSWVFKVDHFSKYGYNDSDDELEDGGDAGKSTAEMLKKKSLLKDGEQPGGVEKKGDGAKEKEASKYTLDKEISLQGDSQYQDEDILHQSMYVDNMSEDDYVQMDMPMHIPSSFGHPFKTSKNIQVMKSTLFAEDDRSSDGGGSHISIMRQYLDMPEEINTLPLIREEVIPKRRVQMRPKVDKVYKFGGFAPISSSIPNRNYMDMCVFKGKSFKVGWQKGFSLYNVNNEAIIRGQLDFNVISCGTDYSTDPLQDCLADSLDIVLQESCFSLDHENVPTFKIVKNGEFLKKQVQLFSKLVDTHNDPDSKYLHSIWTLAKALWDPEEDDTIANRRYLLSEWLRSSMVSSIDGKSTEDIFDLLTVFDVNEASNSAMKLRFPYLSLLISGLSLTNTAKLFLQEQVDEWYKSQAALHISPAIKKIYLLLSGIPLKDDANVFDGVDWKRAFGMHLWYVSPLGAPIESVIDLYEKSFGERGYAERPDPPYRRDEDEEEDGAYDILYHMLVLYKKRVHRLSSALNPATHTRDPLDYRLCWLLLQLFLSLDVGIVDDSEKDKICTSFSNQLEALGEWEWAIYVLLYLEDNSIKKNLVMGILDRNLSPETDENVLESQNILVDRMEVPPEWIHLVKGEKLLLMERYFGAFNHLVYAGDYNRANDILVEQLLPNLFINAQYDIIKKLIDRISDGSREILNWENEAGLFLDFLEFQNGVISSKLEDQYRLESDLRSIIDRISRFPIKTDQQKLCIAEMSKRCISVCKMCDELQSSRLGTVCMDLLDKLFMPPAYQYNEALYQLNKHFQQQLVGNLQDTSA